MTDGDPSLTDDAIWRWEGKELDLWPGEQLTIVWESKEVARKSDAAYSFFGTASKNPTIVVEIDPDLKLDYRVKFASRHQTSLRTEGSGYYSLPDVLLPRQVIRLRWWPKSAMAKRKG